MEKKKIIGIVIAAVLGTGILVGGITVGHFLIKNRVKPDSDYAVQITEPIKDNSVNDTDNKTGNDTDNKTDNNTDNNTGTANNIEEPQTEENEVTPNFGEVNSNFGEVKPNFGEVTPNKGEASQNTEELKPNFGEVTPNKGEVYPNPGTIDKKTE